MSHVRLTDTERKVLRMLCQGMTPKQIGPLVGTRTTGSRHTVHNYVHRAKDKLGTETTEQTCVVFALMQKNSLWVRDLLYNRSLQHPWKKVNG